MIGLIMQIDMIAFDADDTLWHNENVFYAAQEKFRQMLAGYHSPEWIDERLYDTEIRNLQHFGYGVKGFVLSMIETAIELTEGRVTGAEIQSIVNFGREMLATPIHLLDHVEEVVTELAQSYPTMVITKGDLLEQETKVARSGLADLFTAIEVVSAKTPESYAALLTRHDINPRNFVMIGNSPKSDIMPIVELGGWAVHIPYDTTWAHEQVEKPTNQAELYSELVHIGLLPALITELANLG